MSGRSCLKRGLMGCGACSGIVLLPVVFVVGCFFFYQPGASNIVDRSFDQVLAGPKADASLGNAKNTKPIRLVFDYHLAMVDIAPGAANSTIHWETLYDEANFEWNTELEEHQDYIEYSVSLKRRGPGFLGWANFKGDPASNQIYIRLPEDLVYDIRLNAKRGSYDVDLGGLALEHLDIQVDNCDFGLSCSKPNQQVLKYMSFVGNMGSFRINDLQNLHFKTGSFEGKFGDMTLSNSGDFFEEELDLNMSMTMGTAKIELPRSAHVFDDSKREKDASGSKEAADVFSTQVKLGGGVSFGEHTITYRTRLPRADQLMRRMFHETDDPEEVIARIRKIYEEDAERYDFNETSLNNFGYLMMRRNNPTAAVEIFKFNIEIHPDYSNGFDSLAEGYMNNGQHEEAIHYYEKSLEMNPYNTNGKRMLRKIREEMNSDQTPDTPATPTPAEKPKSDNAS